MVKYVILKNCINLDLMKNKLMILVYISLSFIEWYTLRNVKVKSEKLNLTPNRRWTHRLPF